jgi:hypothetical protein
MRHFTHLYFLSRLEWTNFAVETVTNYINVYARWLNADVHKVEYNVNGGRANVNLTVDISAQLPRSAKTWLPEPTRRIANAVEMRDASRHASAQPRVESAQK